MEWKMLKETETEMKKKLFLDLQKEQNTSEAREQ